MLLVTFMKMSHENVTGQNNNSHSHYAMAYAFVPMQDHPIIFTEKKKIKK